jgi:hypothetical protein
LDLPVPFSSFTVTLSTNWNKPRWNLKIPVGFMGEEAEILLQVQKKTKILFITTLQGRPSTADGQF